MTLNELEALWNSKPDRENSWDELGVEEFVSFAQEVERAACLSAVKGVMVTDHSRNTWKRCVNAIEKRSNVELTGGALAPSSDRRERG